MTAVSLIDMLGKVTDYTGLIGTISMYGLIGNRFRKRFLRGLHRASKPGSPSERQAWEQGASVRYVALRSTPAVPIWDFRTLRDLFQIGYDIMKNEISGWPQKSQSSMKFLLFFTRNRSSAVTQSKLRYLNQLQLE